VATGDARLRGHERLQQLGLLDERAAWMRARVRRGDLEVDRLRLAAYLGDEAARAALSTELLVPGVQAQAAEVADLQAFRAMLSRPRAVALVHVPWSGPSHLSRRRFREVHAPILRGLAPELDIGLHVLLPESFPGYADGETPPVFMWLMASFNGTEWSTPTTTGTGHLLWLRDGKIVETAHPTDVLDPTDFVRVTVRALGLGVEG
jgi:hypothetical protein